MQKSNLKNGANIYAISVRMLVTKTTFTATLTDRYYGGNEDFPEKLTKKDALIILKRGLLFSGIRCEYGDENLGSDNIDSYNEIFEKAKQWVEKNHPYLT